MKIILLFILLFAFNGETFCQNDELNSFKADYENGKNSTSSESAYSLKYYQEHTASSDFSSHSTLFKAMHFLAEKASTTKDTSYLELLISIGARLQDAGEYEEAYYYIYAANEQKSLIPKISEDLRKTLYIQSAFSRYYFRRFNEARDFLHKAYRMKNLTVYDSIQVTNTLGLICRDKKELECSKNYFYQTLGIAKRNNNVAWIGISSGNLGNYYFTIKDYKNARKFSLVDFENSLDSKDYFSAINILSILIRIDVEVGDLNKAKQEISQLEQMLQLENSTESRLEYLLAKEAYLEATGDYKALHETHKNLVTTQDTLIARRDKENNMRTEFQVRFEEEQGKVKLLNERKIRSEQFYLSIVIISIIMMISLAFIIYQISRRRKIEKEILRKEKEQLNKELLNAETEMRGIIQRLIEKNEIIEILENDLAVMQKNNNFKDEEKLELKSKLQSFILLTDDDWISFKLLFEKLNPDFFDKITMHLPDLTPSEIRMVTLLKLNLSANEMARALAISVESVRRGSLRLRKKLGIVEHEDLVKFIFTV